ncbi:hypothetical protein GCM10009678_74720 [Actinomadura kijaniata]
MRQDLPTFGCVIVALLFLSIPAYVLSLMWLGHHGDRDGSEVSFTVVNESQHVVRVRIHRRPPGGGDGWCWTTGVTCPPGTRTRDWETSPGGGERFLGDQCGPTSAPNEKYLHVETEDGRAATYGPPLCQGSTWRITEESLRKGVKLKPSPPLWGPEPTGKSARPAS